MKSLLAAILAWAALMTGLHAAEKPAVVFIGSSTIARWSTLEKDFPHLFVIHSGLNKIGDRGALISDINVGRNILSHRPSAVVIYLGENDLWNEDPVLDVYSRIFEIVDHLHQSLPSARIVIISIKPSPMRWGRLKESIRYTNQLLKYGCSGRNRYCAYVDVYSSLLKNGEPDTNYFDPDMLHLNSGGYELLRSKIDPVLHHR